MKKRNVLVIAGFFVIISIVIAYSLPPQRLKTRVSFFEVHLEPRNANDDMFRALTDFVNLADQYKVKLTILFSPQWAEMVLKDAQKLAFVHHWQQNGHEIGGHHHAASHCSWDGYTNLVYGSPEFKQSQALWNCPKFERAQDKYLGTMEDYMKVLRRLAAIKTITMNDEDIDWSGGVFYAAGGLHIQEAISWPRVVNFNGYQVYKITSAPLIAEKRAVAKIAAIGRLITLQDLKNAYLSDRQGIFGVVAHDQDYDANPGLYKEWFEFLKEQNPEMSHAKTVSRAIEETE